MPSARRKEIRDAALAKTVGRWVDEIERALDGHVDQGRDIQEEAREVLRSVLEQLAREDLGDKVVFLESGTFPLSEPAGDPEEEGDWPTELPRAARETPSDEGKVEDEGYSGPIRLPEDLRKPLPHEPGEGDDELELRD